MTPRTLHRGRLFPTNDMTGTMTLVIISDLDTDLYMSCFIYIVVFLTSWLDKRLNLFYREPVHFIIERVIYIKILLFLLNVD